MQIEVKNISSSLNKAYLAQNLFVEELALFKKNYVKFFSSIKPSDSEETLKDYVNEFLKNTYFNNKFSIKENVNNIDLVIYNGTTEQDKIGVIIETKALKNNVEMISTKNLNKKAFHELIQYYLEERITNSNIEIKHLIITNTIDWFIFNAIEFERVFYLNKQLNKNFIDWSQGTLVHKNKDWFYNEIAKPFIENSEETIVCNYFQLTESTKLAENELIELYKVFSPEHLLKLPFANDSNTLNQNFYAEILHLIGLFETKDSSKKIERLKPDERNDGSFLESVISIIENDDVLKNIEKPELFGETKDEQIFSISLELCLTWFNRIIFLKLLENQLVKYNNNNKEYLFLNTRTIKNFNDLRELFFDVLAVKHEDRKEILQKKYIHIPYLNSSLFEQTSLEREVVKINHLKHDASLPIFANTVLKDDNGKRISGAMSLLNYLFEFLDSYNFASSTKLEVQEKQKTLINSSVLGLIFEKLNGYKDGSFYTPGYVTMYICRETIRKTVLQKFNTTFEWNCKSMVELYNQISKTDYVKANQAFNSIRICDPAVGSGHFLVSALNEMLAIKSELGILIDSQGKLVRNVYCEVQNDELFTTHFDKLFVYNFRDKENQRIQETLFKEKRAIIENCLFGVDINPKSVQICRLRLWIELLKNSYYKQESKFTELETLPNIDINIKHGNSLVSFFNFNGNSLKNGHLAKVQRFTKEYKIQVELYKHETGKQAKEKIVEKIKQLKNDFMQHANPNDKDYKELKKKESEHGAMPMLFSHDDQLQWQEKQTRLFNEIAELQKIIDEKNVNLYANAFEWRFEFPEVLDDNGNFVGFDAIIGNPPYISAVNMARNKWQKEYFKNAYPQATGAYDIFILFLKKATELLKTEGSYAWIIPNKFLAAQYAKETKELLINSGLTFSIDISHIKVFEKASVYPIMIFGKNNHQNGGFKQFKVESENGLLSNTLIEYSEQKKYSTFKELGIKIMSGATGFEAQKLKPLISEKQVKGSIPFVVSGCIDRYSIDFENVRYMKTLYSKAYIQNNKKTVAETKWKFWNSNKIVVAGMTKEIEAIWSENPLALGVGIYGIYEFANYDPKFLLGLLNSSFMTNFVVNKFRDKHLAGGYLAINKNMIEEFPIIEIDKFSQEPIIQIVQKIIELKKENPKADTKKLEKQINKEVYKLYKLTKEEVEIIENKLG